MSSHAQIGMLANTAKTHKQTLAVTCVSVRWQNTSGHRDIPWNLLGFNRLYKFTEYEDAINANICRDGHCLIGEHA